MDHGDCGILSSKAFDGWKTTYQAQQDTKIWWDLNENFWAVLKDVQRGTRRLRKLTQSSPKATLLQTSSQCDEISGKLPSGFVPENSEF